MGLNRYQRRIAVWIACFAVLLAALAPAISHAINAARLAECCSENGSSAHHSPDEGSVEPYGGHTHPSAHADHSTPADASADASHSDHASKVGLHFEHCPFCFTHAGSFGLAPVTSITSQPDVSGTLRPALFYRSPQPLFVWTSPQSRAPPTVS